MLIIYLKLRIIKKCLDDETVKDLTKRFSNTHNFCNDDINKFAILLRKGLYPYEYMHSWEKFNETELPSQESFYSELRLEGISESDYERAKSVLKNTVKIWGIVLICMYN